MESEKYIPTIGLEIHAELKTASKMFCSCRNNPDEEKPNTNVCPICLGHPGTLPVLNKQAIMHVLRVGTAIGAKLADFREWDRKNYFYPDIPKGYQISQYKFPLVSDGELAGVAVERIHLEEDTAQSTHDIHENSLVNFNRSGVPLMELVTKPVIHDAVTAVTFAKELQLLLRYLGAGEANMEKGEMRVEANISIASPEDTAAGKFGTKTEVKNLNSFRSVERAIEYELERQASLLEEGGTIVQETRGWDDASGETYSQRSKESSHDYRYFPDPDIPKLKISEIPEFALGELKKDIPELPAAMRVRFAEKFGMTPKEVAVCVESRSIAKYYESVIAAYPDDQKRVKLTTNYMLSDYLGLLKRHLEEGKTGNPVEATNVESSVSIIPASSFSELISMIAAGDLSSRGAKDVLPLLIEVPHESPKSIAEKHGLIQKNDPATIIPIIEKVLADNPAVITDYKAGKAASLQFLIGQVMKATKGANPEMVRKLLLQKLV
jgi:aspartyl-tRNA(Asn)/glutamyl-tRNA(Gln) amidotransferase subunit B